MSKPHRRDREYVKRLDVARVGEAGTLLALVAVKFSVPDLNTAAHVSEAKGFRTEVASTARALVSGSGAQGEEMNFVVNHHPDELSADAFAGLILPGGEASVETLLADPDARKLIAAFLTANKPICAMGAGVALLAALSEKSGFEGDAALAMAGDIFTGAGETAREDAVNAFVGAAAAARPQAA
ncbi:MAG: DJ-1/PfpI family protein [Pseudomonadota bacterium]